ncbi:unnamed protein product [Hymenolepis diminuta]|uniref:Usp domain-containing protein n=1 Tax=Hymenolepis diminuta TaxID=6216 RepID=A0A0R3SUP9_HYMDI|nr:unnamed protein product [Hymenolepis diminuta]VUZ57811.1 unnamed protein product [Hymenolepis diminuta]
MQEEKRDAITKSASISSSSSSKGIERTDSLSNRLILVPVQDDSIAERLFTWYYQYFRRPEDELIVLTTVEPTLQMQKVGVSSDDPLVEAAMVGGRNIIRRFLQRAHERSIPCRGVVQLDISPALSIVRTARERGAHIILMCPRGNLGGESGKTEFDSATEYVLRNCPDIALAIVPPTMGERRIRRNSFYKEYIDNFM